MKYKCNLNKSAIACSLAMLLISCNSGSPSSNTNHFIPTQYDQTLNFVPGEPLKLTISNSRAPITALSDLNPFSVVPGNLIWSDGPNIKNFNNSFTCFSSSSVSNSNIKSIVNVDSNNDIVFITGEGTLYSVQNSSNSLAHSGCSNPYYFYSDLYNPVATDHDGNVFYANINNNSQYVIYKSAWNNLSSTLNNWSLNAGDVPRFIDVDSNGSILVTASNNYIPGSDNIYFSSRQGSLNLLIPRVYSFTAAKLVDISGNGNLNGTAFLANRNSTKNITELLYFNIGNQNPNQPFHVIDLPTSETGNISAIAVNTNTKQIILGTSTGNVYTMQYIFNSVNGSNNYQLIGYHGKVYSTDKSGITSLTIDNNGAFFVGTNSGNIYAYTKPLASDQVYSNPNFKYGLIENSCTIGVSYSGKFYKRCEYNNPTNNKSPYLVETPVYATSLATYGYGGGAGVSCTDHDGSSGGSGVKVSAYTSNLAPSYKIYVGGGGRGSTYDFQGGGGNGGGSSAVVDSNGAVINVGGGGGGGGMDCYSTAPDDGGASGGDAGNDGNGGKLLAGKAGNYSTGGNGGAIEDDSAYSGGNNLEGSGGAAFRSNKKSPENGASNGTILGIGYGTGGAGYSITGGGGGGAGYGGGGGNNYYSDEGTGGGAGGGGGGNYPPINTVNTKYWQGSAINGAQPAGYDHNGPNGGNGYELLIFN